MAENSISQAASFINDNSTICVDLTEQNKPAVRSDVLAHHFNRSHKNVLRDIAKLRAKCPESFYRLNFEPIEIDTFLPHSGGIRKDRAYLLTRDGFSLLVMGFTGAEAVRWKLRYIEAFNMLEAAALEDRAERVREAAYQQGLDEGRASVTPLLNEARQETAQLFWRLGPVQKRRVRQAVRYHAMGLGKHSIAKLLDVDGREVSRLLKAAQALGWLEERAPERPALPVQGNLLALTGRREVHHG